MDYSRVIQEPSSFDFTIQTLGERGIDSPLSHQQFIEPDERVSFATSVADIKQLVEQGEELPGFEQAGPREKIFHNPKWSKAAIVTCGGLCPGINDVIKGLVQVLWFDYGVENIIGIPYGYQGLNPTYGHTPINLSPDIVDTIHEEGGTILGSSRGSQSTEQMVDTLQRMNINMLFCVGGDGTLRGAEYIAQEVTRRSLSISVIGIPKTIDNDLSFIDRTFGFETAVYSTHEVVTSAHMEAKGAFNGVGLIKLMGRDSGFIAAYASLANSVVNFCLVPEMNFTLKGENGLLKALERRFERGKTHVVIVVAEGAGQELFENKSEVKDASGNVLKQDIGELIRDEVRAHFKAINVECSVKYFDPSYLIRSVSAQGTDAIFCFLLAKNAVHAAMAGKTNMVIGHWADSFTHVPIHLATMDRKKVNQVGSLWRAVLGATRQNDYFYGTSKGAQ
ncbi:MAG: ATP-dependent 6-phosphofructokinase [Fibrobacterales bacterium]